MVTEAVVVLHLVEGVEGKGHHLYEDNFYPGPSLYTELQKKGIGACGTARLDGKGMSKECIGNGKNRVKGRMKKADVETKTLNSDKLTALQGCVLAQHNTWC